MISAAMSPLLPHQGIGYEPHTHNCKVWRKLKIGFLQEISNLEKQLYCSLLDTIVLR